MINDGDMMVMMMLMMVVQVVVVVMVRMMMVMMVVMMMNIWCLMILMADSCRMVPPFMLLPMLLCSPPSSPTIRNQYLINLPQPTSPNHPLWNILDFLKFAAERDFFRIVFCSGYPDCDFRECAKSAR